MYFGGPQMRLIESNLVHCSPIYLNRFNAIKQRAEKDLRNINTIGFDEMPYTPHKIQYTSIVCESLIGFAAMDWAQNEIHASVSYVSGIVHSLCLKKKLRRRCALQKF